MSVALHAVECAGPASERLLRALAPFGLVVQRVPRQSASASSSCVLRVDQAEINRLLAMPPGSIALLTGPSGCGKSMLLRATASAMRARGGRVVDASALLARAVADRPIIDLFSGSLVRSLRLLSAAGLGEAMLWARSAAELSDGQRARLGMALAMARVTRGRETLMLIDECCSTLDRVSARCVARTLRRWCSRQGRVRVLCATAHDDLAEAISPDLLLCMEKTEATP
ncbi:hypothetical protein MNBD_PLANCTO03-1152 [hydrothermal vent metagenome]|uniref:AAA+ ATPase domain-containing protein n=1 Tax=hydrothermal vent metagenome TaxID=652676 RepID=A0A3B1DDW8_9ZZZZ